MMDDGIRRFLIDHFGRLSSPQFWHHAIAERKRNMRRAFASVTVPEACRLQASGGRSSEDQVGAELEHTAVLKQRGCEPLCAVRDGEPPRHRISSFGFQCTSWRLRVTSREE